MASHGRRHASARIKMMKTYKNQVRRANTKIRKLNKSTYGGDTNPAINQYTENGRFPKAKGMNINQLRRFTSKAKSFNRAETSTPKGAKRVLHQTIRNIFGGHGQTTEQEVQSMNNIEIYLDDPEKGSRLIKKYFDVFYKVKDKLASMHISNVSSDEIMDAIKEVTSTDELIKHTRHEISTHDISEDTTEVQVKIYFDLLDSAELIDKVIDELGY